MFDTVLSILAMVNNVKTWQQINPRPEYATLGCDKSIFVKTADFGVFTEFRCFDQNRTANQSCPCFERVC